MQPTSLTAVTLGAKVNNFQQARVSLVGLKRGPCEVCSSPFTDRSPRTKGEVKLTVNRQLSS